ncbi:MAG: Hpt domain-containing protein [Lachnospiraceae bacterium]|nr:Hpt domain-containing protein [Lachnospiraceae bacterium]
MSDFDMNTLSELGLDVSAGMSFTGGRDRYLSALQRYYKSYDANREKVESALSSSDIENYTILVHALKSNSKMIGAADLGGLFEELEMAGKAGDTDKIRALTQKALADYQALHEKLRPVGEMEQVQAAGEISGDVAKETAEALLAALDDFDDELSAKLAAKLSGYPFRITQKTKLKEATDYISDFMYDEAAALIREILPAIE